MAGTETYGGCCPKCLKAMAQKYESWSGFQFEACPHCGFIYAEVDNGAPVDGAEAWKVILDHCGGKREEFIRVNNLREYESEEASEFYPSIFDYSGDEGTLAMYILLWKQSQDDQFRINGLRVFWYEDREQEGTMMSYENGLVTILWDAYKTSNQPAVHYPAVDVGKTIMLVEPLDKPPVIGEDDWVNEEVYKALNYLQHKKAVDVREIREAFMSADTELFVATNSDDWDRLSKAQEAIAEIVDNIRKMLVSNEGIDK